MIKFRAWDKRRKEMWKVATLHIEDEYADLFKTNIYEKQFDNPWAKFEDLILMQSTGLKDKNGVEIYEGDVVKVSDGGNEEDSYTSVVKNYANDGYPAFDIEAPSLWHYESNILAAIMGGDYETIEVIGNIWEDGDLTEYSVHHINHNKLDSRKENLSLVLNSAHNSAHMIGIKFSSDHRKKIGEANKKRKGIKMKKRHKIPVHELNDLLKYGFSILAISELYDVNWSTVKSRIHENPEFLEVEDEN